MFKAFTIATIVGLLGAAVAPAADAQPVQQDSSVHRIAHAPVDRYWYCLMFPVLCQ